MLVDTSVIPDRLAGHGLEVCIGDSFGGETSPEGLRTVIGHRVA
ncbi:MAG: hypothetical protein ACR2KC_01455 [Acidimicrobiales bacterium]